MRQGHRVALRSVGGRGADRLRTYGARGSTDWVPLEQAGDKTLAGAGAAARLWWWVAGCTALAALAALGALGLRRRGERLGAPERGRVV